MLVAADPLVLSFWRCTRRTSTVWSSLRTTCNRTKNGGEWGCAVCADDKLFGGKHCCGTFGDKSPFHYEHKFQQKASFSNMIYYIPWFYRLFKRRSDILLVWKNARISDISKFWAFGFANLVTVEKNMEGVAWKHSKIRLVDTSHKNVETVGAEQVALQPRHHFRMCRRQVGRWCLPAPRIGSSGLMLRSPPYVRSKIKIKIDAQTTVPKLQLPLHHQRHWSDRKELWRQYLQWGWPFAGLCQNGVSREVLHPLFLSFAPSLPGPPSSPPGPSQVQQLADSLPESISHCRPQSW